MAYEGIENDLLNHPWLTTEQILDNYRGFFFTLREADIRQIIDDVKNINFIDDTDLFSFEPKTQQNEDKH